MKDPGTKKSLGQHWLRDQESLQAMCDAASVTKNDYVLEIGPGLGTLTRLLTEQAKQVHAVEFDQDLARDLPARVQAQNMTISTEDILSFDFTSMPAEYKLVANIPYYLTSNLIRVISETSNPPSVAVMLVQKEVAERVAAEPGDMSLLSVSAQYYWHVSLDMIVPAELFKPAPKIDSQILKMDFRTKPLFDDVNEKEFFRVVKAGYSQRRKTLLNSLSGGLQMDKAVIKTVCESVDINPGRRAQTLSLDEWHNLYLSLSV